MSLTDYQKKRDFNQTSEPKGEVTPHKKKLIFVVQKHHASHLHYDFRLEMEGVLKSWAVPKGPSLNPADKRLAMMVEDHPYSYRTFEGSIPKGNYGAGDVIVWDEGTYQPVIETSNYQEQLLKEFEAGEIKFSMFGNKLKGEFRLIRLKKDENKWYLIKKHDSFATELDIQEQVSSVRSWEILKEDAELVHADLPQDLKPMLASLGDKPFNDNTWLFEVKWDGYRAVAEINSKVRLYSRNNQTFNKLYPSIVDELEKLRITAVLDGELVVLDKEGKPQFNLLQNYQNSKGDLVYMVFDILHLNGEDLTAKPLVERKEILKKVLKNASSSIRYSDHVIGEGVAFFEVAKKSGLEGIMAKRITSKYELKRSHNWIKLKVIKTQEAIICGYTEPKGNRKLFGALILAVHDGNDYCYVGHTGGGFNSSSLADLYEKMIALKTDKSVFKNPPKTNSPVTWIKSQLVCEVKFSEWTPEGLMRQPIFLHLRTDKPESAVEKEVVEDTTNIANEKNPNKLVHEERVKVVHLEKVFWPEQNYTKGDLVEYYREISPILLPYIKDRPETLYRFPNGIEGKKFYQKDLEIHPPWIKTYPVLSESENKTIDYLLANDLDSLLYMINLGCIEVNPWSSRIQTPDNPDFIILDLDPQNIGFSAVVETAQKIHELCDKVEMNSFCKTSGATGLHVILPIDPIYDYKQVEQFANVLGILVQKELPHLTSLERSTKKRGDKVYLDYLQNRKGQTIASVYSVRPRPYAPVSTPLEWSEVDKDLDPTKFTIKNTLKRIDKLGDLWKETQSCKNDLLQSFSNLEKLMNSA